jgi:hypothetical protein
LHFFNHEKNLRQVVVDAYLIMVKKISSGAATPNIS